VGVFVGSEVGGAGVPGEAQPARTATNIAKTNKVIIGYVFIFASLSSKKFST
jgi:hypothetical protein